MSIFDFEDVMRMGFIFLALYGFVVLIAKVCTKILDFSEEVNEEKRRNFFDTSKIVLIGVIVGLLYYLTPIMQETVKIILSLIVTLGAFITTFVIKEKNGYNFISRIAVFIGELFFGVTMFLLMVNTNLGYSPLLILLIWSIFNFYIYKQFGNSENKVLFGITLTIDAIIGFTQYVVNFKPDVLLISMAVILLVCQFFNIRKNFLGQLIHNVFVTFALILTIECAGNSDEVLSFLVTIILLLGTIAIMVFASKEEMLNPRSFLTYIPFVAVLLVNGWFEELGMFISIFNILVMIWLLSNKSFYKKLLAGIGLIECSIGMLDYTQSDALYSIIVITSVVLTLVLLLEPKKKVVIEEGAVENEE